MTVIFKSLSHLVREYVRMNVYTEEGKSKSTCLRCTIRKVQDNQLKLINKSLS